MINIFIVASKGIPAKYGGFETFVENLTKRRKSSNIHYFVSCMSDKKEEYDYNDAHCFSIPVKRNSAFYRIINVSNALKWVEKYIKKNNSTGDKNIVYILGCRVGLLMKKHNKRLHKLGCTIICNPDGLEWKRDKWSGMQKKVLLMSEKRLIKYSDYIVCDSIGIQDYILGTYKFVKKQNTAFIAYGSDVKQSAATNESLIEWLSQFSTKPNEYYLIVGRFVPENNYELMIGEFMKSQTKKKLLIITNVEKDAFYEKLSNELHFEDDSRIIFTGTLYDEELLKKIRENAFAYLHGHSVGGTNPSLLEALASTKVNILYDVSFNKEVGQDQCLYFNNENDNLSDTINMLEEKHQYYMETFNSKQIIIDRYSWDSIVDKYENYFVELGEKK